MSDESPADAGYGVLIDPATGASIPEDGISYLQAPPPMMSSAERKLWQRIQTNTLLGLPPATPAEHLIRAVLAELRQTKGGCKISVAAVLTGVSLGVAQTHGIRIPTHPRDVARDLGVRYQTLLNIRKVTSRVIREQGIQMELPEWLGWEWGT